MKKPSSLINKIQFSKLPTKTNLRKKSRQQRNQQIIPIKKQINFKQQQQLQQHNIYASQKTSLAQSQSSFQLQQDIQTRNKAVEQKQSIQKVLARLGLNNKNNKKQNKQLEFVVNNIIQNCIGSVDTEENINTYEEIYRKQYDKHSQQKITQTQNKGSIFISQLQDLEKIQKISNYGLFGLYKYIRLIMKKISILCQCIVQHPIFQSFILLTIVLNSFKMALDDPLQKAATDPTIQNTFTVLYTMQMVIKIIAFGFILPPKAYLKDTWNLLDFIIVMTSLLPLVIDINFSVKSLRAIRVLRPLKTITKVKSLKMIVSTLFYSFSLVMDSLYILIFVMIVFSIAGTQLFSGLMQNRCMDLQTGYMTEILCTTGSMCDGGLICAKGISSPNFSINNFDTFFWSMLSVFRTLTLQGWSDIMLGLQHVYSPFSFVYSVMIVFFCQYVLLNMTLAILKYKYSQVKGNTIQQEQQQINQYQPQFLKKIGIFNQVSKLSTDVPLVRYECDTKIFVGSKNTYQQIQKDSQRTNFFDINLTKIQDDRNQKKKSTLIKQKTTKLDIQQLKSIGKVTQQKWDAKTLQFQSIKYDQTVLQAMQGNKKQLKTQKTIKQQDQDNQIQSDFSDSQLFDGQQNQFNSSSQYSNQEKRQQVEQQLHDMQKKLNKNHKFAVNPTPNNNILRSNKLLPQVPNPSTKIQKQMKSVRQLDLMLKLIGQAPSTSLNTNKYKINLPEIDLQQIQIDRLYERFNDLGQYKIKRVQKANVLNYFQIKHNKRRNQPNQDKKKGLNLIKQIAQQVDLDLKQLQLVNQLSKKQLKCRIKARDKLQQYKNKCSYDITRVIVSQKVKQLEKRQQDIIENMNSLNFSVNYKFKPKDSQQQNQKSSKIHNKIKNGKFRRNLNNQLTGIKIPQMIAQKNIKIKTKITFSNKSLKSTQGNNTYLKLLQSHQMQQKIQLQHGRIMQIFFKKDDILQKQKEQKKQKQQKQDQKKQQLQQQQQIQQLPLTLMQQYNKIKQDDIFQRHGKIYLQIPNQSIQFQQQLIKSINMKPEQYEIYIKGTVGMFNVMRKKTLLFVTSSIYDNSMLLLVIANTIILAMNGLVDTDSSPFSQLNTVFTFAFAIDFFLKVFAFGIEFFGDIMNMFDAFVVSISIVEMSFGSGGSNLSALRAVRILRAFRVLRITRLIRTLNYMKIVMAVVSSIITQFVYIFMLLTLFIFIYTLLGMQIFAGQFLPQSVTGIRQSFDTLFNACFSVFQVLTVENWNDIQTLVLTSQTGVVSVFYLLSWIFIGNWILLNLLQAILLDGFDQDSDIFNQDEQSGQIKDQTTHKKSSQNKHIKASQDQQESQFYSIDQEAQPIFDSSDASLFMFLPNSPIRQIAVKISTSMFLQGFIILMIACSSVKLVIDTYIIPGSDMQKIADLFDLIFNFVFIFQSLIKIIAQGLLIGDKAYLKSSWSKLDFFIVFTAIIDMSIGIDLSILKLFRTLRPLRIISRNPDMKIIISSLAESMLGIFNVLIIIMCIFLMFGILGINLLQNKLNFCNPTSELTHGQFGPYGINKQQCQITGGVWTTQFINFDNIGSALLSLYVFSTRQNWPYYSLTFMDATQDGPVLDNSQLIFMIYTVIIIFVCSYFFMDLLVGVLFMNFHEAQAKIRPKTLTDKQINWKNLQKVIISQDPNFHFYLQPSNAFNKFFYKIVNLKFFDPFVTVCILGNILVMMVAQNDQTKESQNIQSEINFIFSIIFIIECVLKILTFGKGYFLSGWNVFDFFVVMASLLDIMLQVTGSKTASSSALSILPQIARIFRVLRVTKLLRMFKRFKGLQKLIQTFLFSLPALARGLSIVCLFLFISSVFASNLFAEVSTDYSGNLDDTKNFKNFHSAFQLLFIMTTGQNWYFYMFQTIQDGYITCKDGSQDCTNWYYLVFWIFYVFLSQKVFMELFVLIVLDQFEANYINQNNPLGIFALFEDDFRSKWIDLTGKYHSEKIQFKKLIDLLLSLKQPLGLGKNQLMIKYEQQLRENQKITEEQIAKSLNELDLKLKKTAAKLLNKISAIRNRMYLGYHQTFYNFAKLSIASEFLDSANEDQKIALQHMHKQSEQTLQKLKPQGNLYYYQQQNQDNLQRSDALNPIELILFCQMIVKSWHNYSQKFHQDKKQSEEKAKKNKKLQDISLYNSLNDSCASDIQQAALQKIQNQAKFTKRKGLMQKRVSGVLKNDLRLIPNVEDHYKNQKKRKNKSLSKKLSISKQSNQLIVPMQNLQMRPSKKRSSHRKESIDKIQIIISPNQQKDIKK